MKLTKLTVLTCVYVLSLSGCSSSQSRIASEDEIEQARQGISAHEQASKYDYGGAHHALTLQCIRDAGHDVQSDPYDPIADINKSDGERGVNKWFDTNVDSVKKELELVVDRAIERSGAEGEEEVTGSSGVQMSDEAAALYYGEPEDSVEVELPNGTVVGTVISGCYGQALETLYGLDASEAARVQTLYHHGEGTLSNLLASDVVHDIATQYSECMDAEGFTVSEPSDLPDEFFEDLQLIAAGEEQLSALDEAVDDYVAADIACKESNDTTGKFAAAYVDSQEEGRDSRERVVASYLQMSEHANKVIEDVFSS